MKLGAFFAACALLAESLAAQTKAPPRNGLAASLFAPVVRTANAARLVAFYRDVLGMRLLIDHEIGSGKREYMLRFGDPAKPDIMILNTPMPVGTTSAAGKGAGQTRLILAVSGRDALVASLMAPALPVAPCAMPAGAFVF